MTFLHRIAIHEHRKCGNFQNPSPIRTPMPTLCYDEEPLDLLWGTTWGLFDFIRTQAYFAFTTLILEPSVYLYNIDSRIACMQRTALFV